jgi:hypothetical protein
MVVVPSPSTNRTFDATTNNGDGLLSQQQSPTSRARSRGPRGIRGGFFPRPRQPQEPSAQGEETMTQSQQTPSNFRMALPSRSPLHRPSTPMVIVPPKSAVQDLSLVGAGDLGRNPPSSAALTQRTASITGSIAGSPLSVLQRPAIFPYVNIPYSGSESERVPPTFHPKLSTRGQPIGPRGRAGPRGGRGPVRGRRARLEANHEFPADGIGVRVPEWDPESAGVIISYNEVPKPEPKIYKRNRYPREHPDTDAFVPFPCEWGECRAELHNLKTLRKHLFNVHGKGIRDKRGGWRECLWNGCEDYPIEFADMEAWKDHMEKVHITAVAWELGDGPVTTPSDVDPSAYLSDANGKQITPLARTRGTPDLLPLGAGPSPTREYHRAHGNVTEEQKRQAVERSTLAHANAGMVYVLDDDGDGKWE